MLRDIRRGDPQVAAVAEVIARADPDVLLLLGFDFDLDQLALTAFADLLAGQAAPYPYRFALRPNTGMATGLDLDGNGRLGEARDAQGFGLFSGAGGMALLSRLPIDGNAARDFSGLRWRDLPGNLMPSDMSPEVAAIQRLSTTAHWEVPVLLPGGETLRLLAWHASPPVFDGPEDRNGRRNHDEAAFWLRLIGGELPQARPTLSFVLLGDANLSPDSSEGRTGAITALLGHPALQGVGPVGAAGLATADFSAEGGPGNLRTDYVLPSTGLRVTDTGVLWPEQGDPLLATVRTASRHRLVWVDLAID